MFGKNVDSLRVLFRLSPHKDVIVWQLEGNHSNGERNHSNEWNKAQIPLDTTGSTTFKVISIPTTEITTTTTKTLSLKQHY
jgi:hypothetical protein